MPLRNEMEEIRSELAQLKDLEEDLSNAKWRLEHTEGSATSPRGVVEGAAVEAPGASEGEGQGVASPSTTTTNSLPLIQRYEQARDLYLQRRLENLLVEHIGSYEEDKADFFDFPDYDGRDTNEDGLNERHAQALANLQSSVEDIQAQSRQLRATYDSVSHQRQELEELLKDLTAGQEDEQEHEDLMEMDHDEDDEDDASDSDDTALGEEAMALEQERIEALQATKRSLQEELSKLEQQTQEVQERTRYHEQQKALLNADTAQAITEEGQTQDLNQKIEELREMKEFYDSLREVLEELGGVKIQQVQEDPANRHLYLNLLFYDQYRVQIELQAYRRIFLKLVQAKWLGNPIVYPSDEGTGKDSTERSKDDFSLTMDSLDDLVQVATTTLGPPHDLRFIVRETLARIRIYQHRVEDLAVLRRQVLTKIHNGNQIVCSLNDGIVVVMRLYEKYVQVEQVIGVSGWDEETTRKIQEGIPNHRGQSSLLPVAASLLLTPTAVIQHVREEIQKIQQAGLHIKTPRLPERKGGFQFVAER